MSKLSQTERSRLLTITFAIEAMPQRTLSMIDTARSGYEESELSPRYNRMLNSLIDAYNKCFKKDPSFERVKFEAQLLRKNLW